MLSLISRSSCRLIQGEPGAGQRGAFCCHAACVRNRTTTESIHANLLKL